MVEKPAVPHEAVHYFLDLDAIDYPHTDWSDINLAWYRASLEVTSLIVGLLGGCLALWRYRRLERREKSAGG